MQVPSSRQEHCHFNSPPAFLCSKLAEPKNFGWVRTPTRRKQRRRKQRRVTPVTPLKPILDRFVVALLTLFYFTAHVRSNPVLVLMDAVIITHTCSQILLQMGYAHRYLSQLADSINHTMHSLNGNPTVIHLADLIPNADSQPQSNQEATLN